MRTVEAENRRLTVLVKKLQRMLADVESKRKAERRLLMIENKSLGWAMIDKHEGEWLH
jgi:hypothetical protein